jgi:hypothetical protein
MAMGKREYRQAVRMCRDLDVSLDFLPLQPQPEDRNTFVFPEDELFEDRCNACDKDGIVNLFGMCCNCYAASALIF